MKLCIGIAITLFGSIGSILGAALQGGNEFGLASIALGTLGSFFGVWAGYRFGQYMGL
jgi:membrane protein DedA with SNARE-associated domain